MEVCWCDETVLVYLIILERNLTWIFFFYILWLILHIYSNKNLHTYVVREVSNARVFGRKVVFFHILSSSSAERMSISTLFWNYHFGC